MPLTTEHRPAPLPPRGGPLPEGAVRLSRTWLDADSIPRTSEQPVPVDANDRRTAHQLRVCPENTEVGGVEQPCDYAMWMLPDSPARYCPDHGVPLAAPKADSKRSGIPWAQVWKAVDERARVAAVAAAVGAAGITVEATAQPWWGAAAELAAIPATVAGSWWLTRWWLTRRAIRRGKIDPADEVAGKRHKRLIAKRARTAAYLGAAASSWVCLADLVGVDPATGGGLTMWGLLAGAAVVGSRPYLRWVDSSRQPAEVIEVLDEQPDAEPDPEPLPDELAQLRAHVTDRWTRRIANERGPLPGTVLENITRTVGGWSATIVATDESDLDPERFDADKTIGRIARAYKVGTSMVTITADPLDANRAMVLVQRTSPLAKGRTWDGTGINLATGRGITATLDDGDRIEHTFWRPGWGAVMELIAGCTGSGKSEYINLLLALERESKVCVSWVGDPQMGQSLGDIRDGVDWFAPTVEEILAMLRTAVKVMLARNVIITRMRVEETRPNGTVVQRRVKYVDVSEQFPLLSITIDEAHLPMNDPDHGREIVKLLALLAKSGRKCNIKVRLVTQSPLLSELKDSVLRAQLSSGLVVVFRTADRLTGAAAWPGKMPADPALLPDVWPDGSTAAGVGYMSGQKPLRMRTDWAEDVYDLMHTGQTKGLEQAVLGAAGTVYAERGKRLALFDSLDPAELLGAGVSAAVRDEPKGSGRDAVLRFLADRWRDGDREPVRFGLISDHVKDVVKTRALSNALKKLVDDGLLGNEDGRYRLTERGVEELGLTDEVPV